MALALRGDGVGVRVGAVPFPNRLVVQVLDCALADEARERRGGRGGRCGLPLVWPGEARGDRRSCRVWDFARRRGVVILAQGLGLRIVFDIRRHADVWPFILSADAAGAGGPVAGVAVAVRVIRYERLARGKGHILDLCLCLCLYLTLILTLTLTLGSRNNHIFTLRLRRRRRDARRARADLRIGFCIRL